MPSFPFTNLSIPSLPYSDANFLFSLSRPGQEGPSFGPPPLPEGWIAQWDGMGRKYYFVQLATGTSQWETPTQPAPTGPTPQATPQEGLEHPYGTPEGTKLGEGGDGERGLGVSYFFCLVDFGASELFGILETREESSLFISISARTCMLTVI